MKNPPPNATPQASTKSDSTAQTQPDNLTKEFIMSLSKEIETTMNGIINFRTRVGFGMFVGPFVLLGSFIVGAKGQPVSLDLARVGWVAPLVVIVCFLLIGLVAAHIEAQAYEQCNRWRQLIWRLSRDPSIDVDEDKDLRVRARPYAGYSLCFLLLFVGVVAAVVIIKNAVSVEPAKLVGPATTSRSEQFSTIQP